MSRKMITAAPGVRYYEHEERKHGIRKDRYFFIRFQVDGKRREEGLGWSSEGWTVEKAVQCLMKFKNAAKTGDGPRSFRELRERERQAAAKKAQKGTVEELFQGYVENLRQRERKSVGEVERSLLTGKNNAANALGRTKPAMDVRTSDVKLFLRSLYLDRSKSMAHHMRLYLSAAFNFGIGNEHDYTRAHSEVSFGLSVNPVAAIPADHHVIKPGNRNLSSQEIKSAWNGIAERHCDSATVQALQLLIAIGGPRVNEVLQASKVEFDLEAGTWTLPGGRSKNRRQHKLPLSERALSLVKERFDQVDGPYLFPKKGTPKSPMPCSSLNRAVRRMCEDIAMERFTPRDLRRTCRTRLSDEGVSRDLLNIYFNHGPQGVGEIHYDRSDHLKEKIEVMQKWSSLLDSWLGDTDSPSGR